MRVSLRDAGVRERTFALLLAARRGGGSVEASRMRYDTHLDAVDGVRVRGTTAFMVHELRKRGYDSTGIEIAVRRIEALA